MADDLQDGAVFHRGFEFDYMAQRPMYAPCPRWLLDRCGVGPESTVVDLGCGSGIFTSTVLERYPDAPELRVIAIDPSEWELGILRDRIDDPRVTTFQGRAQEAADYFDSADAVILCNVLHQIPRVERGPVFDGVYGLVRPGGMVGANTLFYDGAIDPDTRLFYTAWLMEARQVLKARGVSWTPPDIPPVAMETLTPEQHGDLLQKAGFQDLVIEELKLDWTADDWAALSRYSVFIQGAFCPEMDLQTGSDALIEAVHTTFDKMGIDTVRRNWLHCAGRK